MSPTSESHKIANSLAFFNSPFLLLEKVTCRLVALSILRITIFPLPIVRHFGLEFEVIAEILGLTRSDGEKIRKCYETYLGVLVSYYKTARAPPQDPIKKEDGSESLEEYDWKLEEKVATEAARKGKEKIEHFGILLEGEGEHKQSESAQKEKESLTKCYKCQDYGHYAFECPLKNKKKIQDMYASYNNSAPKIEEGMDSNSISSEDFYIIT
ncbi:ARID DNA-binding domain-containing protein [Tanacetum coccineum]|uniref:ARID DNA-binding domain-containing protein n=1 Tax=Tanacetum coccineum TaxID=301880 RepID=A0ABQ5A474_9ASTR